MGKAQALIASGGCAFCLLAASMAAGAEEYQRGSAPSWVQPLSVDPNVAVSPAQVGRGVVYLLTDRETRIVGNDRTTYLHYVEKAVDDKGVDRIAHIDIEFDPSYQTLTLHAINLLRGGRVIPKLPSTAIKVLQRERELESRIYDGTKTATAFLEDVRPGDAVEVAYSLKGWNPVFKDQHFGGMDLQWSLPVKHLRYTLSVPAGRDPALLKHQTQTEPVVTERNGIRSYVWELHDIPGLRTEPSTPDWFNPYPAIQWSDFKDWAAVARWATPLYTLPTMPSPSIKAEIEKIAQSSPDPQSRLLAALSFVQTQIRYMGVEVGPGSHAPNPPALVLQRRYGDCKDKALLTVALLRGLGIEASPALVDTQTGRTLPGALPSPGRFNHVIVLARIDGQDYWIDPTRSPQKGQLSRITQADYGHALVLDGTSTQLRSLPPSRPDADKRSILMHFDARGSIKDPVTLTITSTYESAAADEMRESTTPDRLDELQERYINFYAKSYPQIKVKSPISVRDDDTDNRLTVTENYVVSDFWRELDDDRPEKGFAYLFAPDMRGLLRAPREPLRRTPLAVDFPNDFTVTIEALLPGDWAIRNGSWQVVDSAFRFNKTLTYTSGEYGVLNVGHHYQSLSDHVAVSAMKDHVAHLAESSDMVGYTLRNTKRKFTGSWPWVMLGLAVAALGFGLRLFIRFTRHHMARQVALEGEATKVDVAQT
jgi:hypothetical protein